MQIVDAEENNNMFLLSTFMDVSSDSWSIFNQEC